MIEGKRGVYFDSVIEQDLCQRGFPVTAYTERKRESNVFGFVKDERIIQTYEGVVYIRGIDDVKPVEDHISKAELREFISEKTNEIIKSDKNVVVRLDMLAAFQMIKEKFHL